MSAKLGELLLKENILTPQQLREALDYQRTHGGRLGSVLTKLKLISDEEVSLLLSKQYGVPSLNLELEEIDPNVIKIIPEETVRKYLVLPVSRNGAVLTLAMVDPGNVFAIDDIKFMTGLSVEQVVTSEASLLRAIDRYYVREKGLTLAEPMNNISSSYGVFSSATSAAIAEAINEFGEDDAFNLELLETDEEINIDEAIQGSTEAPVIKLVNLLLVNALEYDASDIHIEPYEKEFRIRFRVDGSLREVMRPPQKLRDSLISRIKIMARLDIAEKRLPQDGRIRIKLRREGRSRDLDFRVSTLPTIWGEKVVMRLLDKEKLMLDMTKLGFEPQSLERFKRQIAKPYGMVLVTGPTGSGKTNTLYSAISSLNTPDTNIITAEDPVEFNLTGINQLQVKEQIGLNFAAALRSFLRQDPNIILVGEIRDFETAEIAVKASLTGHLVLSTLHTNDAPSTITRLMNMGIEPFLVATSVNIIQAQRLVRRICNDCKAPAKAQPPLQTLLEIGFSPEDATSITVVEGTGRDKTGRECVTCKGSGYKGRTGLFEVLEMTEELRELVLVGASAHEIRKKAMEDKPGYKGMLTLRQSGLEKIKNGVTTIEEIVRETVL